MADRTATTSDTINIDLSTGGQVKWHREALTGDVTAGAGSNATTIANGVVTPAKMAAIAANTIVANATADSATPTAVPVEDNSIIGRDGSGNISSLLLGEDFDVTGGVISVVGGGGGGGEVNTASNIGTAGVGVYKQKTGVDFEFKKINSGSSKLSVTDDTGANELDLDVVEANLNLANIGGTLALATQATGALPVASMPAFTGAVTTTAGSTVTTLAANAVATSNIQLNAVGNARQAKMAANTVKVNNTASNADATDMVVTTGSLVGRTPTGVLQPITPTSGISITDTGELVSSVQYDGTNFLDSDAVVIPWTIRTEQDILDLDVVRLNSLDEFIDKDDNVLSTTAEVADYTALLALDAAAYENYAFVVDSGLNRSVWVSNGTAFSPLNGQYVHEKVIVPENAYSFPDNVTWTTSNVGGKVVITTGGATPHLVTEVGSYLYLISGGTGWTAGTSHLINAVTTTTITLDTTYSGHTGVPVFAKAGTTEALSEIPLKTITLPALRANTAVVAEVTLEWKEDASTGARRGKFYLDTVQLTNQNTTATLTTTTPYRMGFQNQANASSQRGLSALGSSGYSGGTGAVATHTAATGTAGVTASIRAMSSVPGITVRIASYALLIRG